MEIEDEFNKMFTTFLIMYFLIVILIIENFLRKKLSKKLGYGHYILSPECKDFFYVFKKKEKNTILRFMGKYILS